MSQNLKFKILDTLLSVLLRPAARALYKIRRAGFILYPKCKKMLMKEGVLPVANHYYEPFYDSSRFKRSSSDNRPLPGIDWNKEEQLSLLNQFGSNRRLSELPDTYIDDLSFHFNNGSFISGDAEYWYHLIQLKRPKIIIEIGSGNSTKMARLAINDIRAARPSYTCKHICIEPYEMPWLEKLGVQVIRKKAENMDARFFAQLENDDILFIDSSHVIKPQGDVLFEYLNVLPVLKKGVIVHIHDIFSPKDYLPQWVEVEMRLWNEQYLLEAFLTHNKQWKIIGALNYLHHHHYEKLKSKCPKLKREREPGSFYIQKV